MTIWVHFKTNTINIDIFGYVKGSEELVSLIELDVIYAFKLSRGWVQIGKDQTIIKGGM